jgi:hypothetical protein
VKLATPRWRTPLIFLGVLLLIGVLAPAVSAAPGAATATVTPGTVPAGTTESYTYTLTPTSGQASSFNLTAPTGWTIKSVDSAPSGVQLASGSSTVIQGRGLTITSSSPLTVGFTAQAPCAAADNVAWTTSARTGGNFNGASVSVNDVSASVSGTCTAEFVTGRQAADAEFGANTNGPSQNITSVAYTANGAAIQAIVKDAGGNPRPDTTVTLGFATNPTGATLAGSISAVSNGSGLATFDGTCATCSPITINKIGQGYKLKATGTGVVGTPQPDAFGVYQEGEACATSPCVVHGHNGNNSIKTTVSAGAGGDLGTFVSADVNVACDGYIPLTNDAIVWKYTGGGSQTIVIDLSKSVIRQILDRGSDHLDFCFDSEGKPFTDKFGVDHWGTSGNNTNGLLSDCNRGIDPDNCLVSETGLTGGGRRLTVIVADGRGKI